MAKKNKYGNITLIDSNFERDTCISTAIISTPIGIFSASTTLKPEDIEYPSSFFGCEIAELKAYKKYIKRLLSDNKLKSKFVLSLYNSCPVYEKGTYLIKEYAKIQKEIEELKDLYESVGKTISKKCSERDVYLQEIKKRKEHNSREE